MNKIVISLCDKTGQMVLPWAEKGYRCICIDTQHPDGMGVHDLHENIVRWGIDILSDRVEKFIEEKKDDIVFLSSFPPCTDLTGAGSRWWKSKGDNAYEFAMKLVKRCDDLGKLSEAPYFIENPPGRIESGSGCTNSPSPHRWRKWDYRFQPYEYGGWHADGKAFWDDYDLTFLSSQFTRADQGNGKAEIPRWHRWTDFLAHKGLALTEGMNNDGYHKSTCLWTGGGFIMPDRRPIPFHEFPNMIHHAPPSAERANIRSVTPMGFAYAVYEENHPSIEGGEENG